MALSEETETEKKCEQQQQRENASGARNIMTSIMWQATNSMKSKIIFSNEQKTHIPKLCDTWSNGRYSMIDSTMWNETNSSHTNSVRSPYSILMLRVFERKLFDYAKTFWNNNQCNRVCVCAFRVSGWLGTWTPTSAWLYTFLFGSIMKFKELTSGFLSTFFHSLKLFVAKIYGRSV